jgi:hypothetical protein
VVAAIDPTQSGLYSEARVLQVLQAAKWLLLLFWVCEAAALVLSILLRFVLEPPATAFDNFDEVTARRRSRAPCVRVCCRSSAAAADSGHVRTPPTLPRPPSQKNMQERALTMQHLRSDVESQRISSTNNSVYGKVTAKMQSKYGIKLLKKGWLWR